MNRRTFLKSALSGGALVFAGSYPIFIERNIVQVNRYKIPIDNLPLSFHGFTLAHLTDIHLGFLVSPSFVEQIVHRTNSLNTDAIVCTGDYVHNRNTIEEIDKVWPILSKLSARYGVYSVLGNHDHWGDSSRSLYWLERSGQNIRHQCKAIYKGRDRILIGGAGDLWGDKLNIDKAFSSSDQDDCRILLSLVLSGHTHGGQVVLPFLGALRLPVENKAYSSGLIATPRTPLFISRGIGWAILPVRFNCYPEIAVLELVNPKLTA